MTERERILLQIHFHRTNSLTVIIEIQYAAAKASSARILCQ